MTKKKPAKTEETEEPAGREPQVGVNVHVVVYDEKTDATLEDRDATPEEAKEFCANLDNWIGNHGDSYGDMTGEVSNNIINPKKGSYAIMDFRFVEPPVGEVNSPVPSESAERLTSGEESSLKMWLNEQLDKHEKKLQYEGGQILIRAIKKVASWDLSRLSEFVEMEARAGEGLGPEANEKAPKPKFFFMVFWEDNDSGLDGWDLVYAENKNRAKALWRGEHYSKITEVVKEGEQAGEDDYMFEDIDKYREIAKKKGVADIESGR